VLYTTDCGVAKGWLRHLRAGCLQPAGEQHVCLRKHTVKRADDLPDSLFLPAALQQSVDLCSVDD
jgi:hypothetical protein